MVMPLIPIHENQGVNVNQGGGACLKNGEAYVGKISKQHT